MSSRAFPVCSTLCLLLGACSPWAARANDIALHAGSLDPAQEAWEVSITGNSAGAGGSEITPSGEHSFWDARDSATDGGIVYGVALGAADLSADWRLEAIVRVVDAPICPGCADFGDVGVIVRDGLNYWSFYLGNATAGPISDSGKTGLHSLLLSKSLDTRADYHRYDIHFHQNGPGPEDDSADFFIDGVRVFGDVGRSGLWTSSEQAVSFGAISTAGTGEAHWEWVRFDDGRGVPEPCAMLQFGAGFALLYFLRSRDRLAAQRHLHRVDPAH